MSEHVHMPSYRSAIRFSLLLVVSTCLLLLSACGSATTAASTGAPTPLAQTPTAQVSPATPTPVPAQPTPTPVRGSLQALMIITNGDGSFGFHPSVLSIRTGTTVIWKNASSAPHTVTSDDGQTFDSGTLPVGGTFRFTFAKAGTFSYHCNYHPYMRATILVV
jgi:plastocyanin